MRAERLNSQAWESDGSSGCKSDTGGPRRLYLTPTVRTCPAIPAHRAGRHGNGSVAKQELA